MACVSMGSCLRGRTCHEEKLNAGKRRCWAIPRRGVARAQSVTCGVTSPCGAGASAGRCHDGRRGSPAQRRQASPSFCVGDGLGDGRRKKLRFPKGSGSTRLKLAGLAYHRIFASDRPWRLHHGETFAVTGLGLKLIAAAAVVNTY